MPFDAAYAEMFPLAHDDTPYRKLTEIGRASCRERV
mgnify:CR=1 FL=1